MRTLPRYTPACDALILQNVQANPSNLKASFEVSAIRLNRSPEAIAFRYYQKIKPRTQAVAVASNTGVVSLGKNSKRTQVVPDAVSVAEAMLHASISRLSKDKAIQFLIDNMSNEAKASLLLRISNRIRTRMGN